MASREKNASVSHHSFVGSRGTSVMAVHNVALADVLGKQRPQPLSKRMFMVCTIADGFGDDPFADGLVALRMFANCDSKLLHKRMYGWILLFSPNMWWCGIQSNSSLLTVSRRRKCDGINQQLPAVSRIFWIRFGQGNPFNGYCVRNPSIFFMCPLGKSPF